MGTALGSIIELTTKNCENGSSNLYQSAAYKQIFAYQTRQGCALKQFLCGFYAFTALKTSATDRTGEMYKGYNR